MAEANRDTVYVDIDDEITGIIDKVRSSQAKIVALVLPKRAAVFQSIVNMKLLKRATEQSKKNIVLITTENGLLPLAGAVGIHVAASLTSRPEIPSAPTADDGKEVMVDEAVSLADEDKEITTETAGEVPIGLLAGEPGSGEEAPVIPAAAKDGVETIELEDDEAEPAAAPVAAVAAAADKRAVKKNKKLKVPNFERFRLILVLVIIVVILIVGFILAFKVLPKAAIDIQTDASDVTTNVTMTLDPSATSLNATTDDVPAKMVSLQKTYTATVPASGQQNNGQTATGTVTFSTPCSSDNYLSVIPAGTGVSYNGLTYITQANATISHPNGGKGSCTFTGSTPISAQQPGANYNTPTSSSSVTFTLAQSSDNAYDASTITTSGSASGGTDDIQQVVEQSDITTAEGKINTADSSAKQNLVTQLQQDNLYPIQETFSSGTPVITPSTAAGAPASSVTVSEAITYTMYGAASSDLNKLLDLDIASQVNTSSQGILNDGLSSASFTQGNGSGESVVMQTTAEVGPSISVDQIKQLAVGKKSGELTALIRGESNVTNVSVHLSPFWVTTVPSNLSKITVNIAKPTGASSNGNG